MYLHTNSIWVGIERCCLKELSDLNDYIVENIFYKKIFHLLWTNKCLIQKIALWHVPHFLILC